MTATVYAAAIIAGGRGRRLGGLEKSRLVIGGRPVIDRQLAVLGQVATRVLVVTDDHHRFSTSGLQVCDDVLPGAGPLGGLHTALTRSPGRRTLVVAGDLPFLTGAFLRHLAARAPHADAVVPRNAAGLQPLCAVYDRGCAETIRARIETGGRRLVDLAGWLRVTEVGPDEVAAFDPDGMLLFNVNTPADHARAVSCAARRAGSAGAHGRPRVNRWNPVLRPAPGARAPMAGPE
ncbi:MAG: molybdenum cofactor guanylyltransferase [Acidobacteria bacterium]|nr:molybdenum cofactor guanylyltransferase [Acidobacteriota bacterium]